MNAPEKFTPVDPRFDASREIRAPRGTTLQLTAGSPVSGSATQTISLR